MLVKFLKHQLRRYRLSRAKVVDRTTCQRAIMGGWAVWPQALRAGSVVYSFGVGDSIAWDREMIRRFGVTVHAFDPTPASIAWVARQSLPPQFFFHDYGISDFDGMLDFYPPRQQRSTHFSHERRGGLFDRRRPVQGRVYRLATIMQKLGHERIDVLKLDVEGAEFEAVADLIKSRVEIDQLLIEIHYQFRSRSFRQGLELIQRLKDYGMQCIHVSERGFEFTFVRGALENAPPVPLARPA
jgi:FkbM family methyltransferase